MHTRTLLRTAMLALSASVTLAMVLPEGAPPGEQPNALGMRLGAARLQSAGAMTFGPDNVLFLADSRASTVYALDVADTVRAAFRDGRALVEDLDQKIAALLGTTRDQIRFGDMARHPATGNLYFSITRLGTSGSRPALVRVRGPEQVELVDLDRIRFRSAPLPEAPPADSLTPWGQPKWTLSMTDLAFVDGELWVAGLSNEQFSSSLRRMPFPFAGRNATTTVEIFHTSHNRWETAAPIDAFLPITLGGVPSLLAGYGCSPIVTFRRADMKAGTHLRGRTVAELGGGSRPIDMLRYQRDGKEWVLIANSDRTLMRMDPALISNAPPLEKGVDEAFVQAGVPYKSIASSGVMHITDLGPDAVGVLMRDTESGAVKVVGYAKKWL